MSYPPTCTLYLIDGQADSRMDAAAILERYGNYPVANTFSSNDAVEDLPESVAPLYSAAFDEESGAKRHAACDECRNRKLKCSGELSGCSRCIKQSLTCHYSKQAQMGRPRKRQKREIGDIRPVEPSPAEIPEAARLQQNSPSPVNPLDRACFEAVCPSPFTRSVKSRMPAPPPPFMTRGSLYEQPSTSIPTISDGTPPSESPPTPPSFLDADTAQPTDLAMWPDYSTMARLPLPVQDKYSCTKGSSEHSHAHCNSVDSVSSGHKLPATPACPCLPNLYLTLSTLSTLSSFPVSVHTIESLQTAHRTASSVLYCPVCPTNFQLGMQNVMLLGTLLTVLADNWQRIGKAPSEDLRRGFQPTGNDSSSAEVPLTPAQDLEWRTFAHNLIRANIFGDSIAPSPPSGKLTSEYNYNTDLTSPSPDHLQTHYPLSIITPPTSSTPTLLGLVDAMERRQRFWHDQAPDNGEFPAHLTQAHLRKHRQGMTLDQMREVDVDENGHLCLKIVGQARLVVRSLNQQMPTR